MFLPDQYELLDFGAIGGVGRKLERIAGLLVDRPSPGAEQFKLARPEEWSTATLRFDRPGSGERGLWRGEEACPDTWSVARGPLRLALRPGPIGQLGFFPEQADNWDWIAQQVTRRRDADSATPVNVLNLFAYTGGSTLAAAAAGAHVAHVDAAKPSVQAARQNAELSQLGEAPIRWLVEDAQKFVTRELRRGQRYQGVVLDPPSFGRGAGGEVWQLIRDLPELLAGCAALLEPGGFLLLTAHTTGLTTRDLRNLTRECLEEHEHLRPREAGFSPEAPHRQSKLESGELHLHTRDGRALPSGMFVRLA